MVRDCLKQQSGFGVCLIDENNEADPLARAYPYGTVVKIIDWDSDASGLLVIVTHGLQKFRTISTALNTDRLLMGEVELLPLVQKTTIPTRYSDLVELLRRALLSVETLVEDDIETDFTDSVWVSNRLLETLPMPPEVRYELMVMDDPIQQLDGLREFTKNWRP